MIRIFHECVSPEQIQSYLGKPFPDMVKFVVDIQRGVIALGGELHADAESILLKEGSHQENLWGGNFFPGREPAAKIAYEAMINIRPSHGNRTMEIKDAGIREKMREILRRLLP